MTADFMAIWQHMERTSSDQAQLDPYIHQVATTPNEC